MEDSLRRVLAERKTRRAYRYRPVTFAGRGLSPWPCVHEFLATVTHERTYDPPTPLESALRAAEIWLTAPSVVALWTAAHAGAPPPQCC